VSARAAQLRANLPRPILCSVSRLVPTKRVDLVIRHAARAKMPLVVIGGGPERARLEQLAKEEGVDARFMDTLPRDEALAWIAASDSVVFASEAEGCSTVVREAEALGVRVERVA
jgi:glycosyltransferase involved in cell wall biosynthesis